MNPILIDADDRLRAPGKQFRPREFRRTVGLILPYRGTVALGMLLAILFALLNTTGIAGVFPVLKILLEQEGLQGWAVRTVAEDRLGSDFAPLVPGENLRVAKVSPGGSLAQAGVRALDELVPPEPRSVRAWLDEVVATPAGAPVEVRVRTPEQATTSVTLTVGPADAKSRALHRLAALLPADADTHKLRTLTGILGVLVVVVVLANVCRYAGEVLVARGVLRAMMDLRGRLYERVLRLPMSYFAAQPTADVVSRFVQDVQEIQRGLLTLFGKFVREPLKAVFIVGLALALDWRITLAMVVVAPVAVVLFWTVGRQVRKAGHRLLRAYGTMIDALTATLHNLRVVKAYTAEAQEQRRLRTIDREVFRQQLKLARQEAFISPMLETVAVIAGSVVTVWLAGRVLNEQLSLSKFVQLGFTLSMLFDPLRKLSDVYVRVQRSTAGAERIFSVLDRPDEQAAATTPVAVGPLRERLEFVGVTFTYPGSEVPALRDIDLSVERGETVAVVGPNGCGKTTLMGLLLRFFDPDRGVVRYDGVDLRGVDLASLRRQISLVTQEAVVFAGTPVDNIAYGQDEPDGRHVEAAARRASADEFVRALPGGYAAALGERGTTLSGGQRQRLAIARAIFRDAPILIFDEATSQVDTESEQKIQQALRSLAEGRTTFIIAHRLSTIQFARRIVVMDAGFILDTGTHAELFERCPLYRTLCETQFLNASA